jgi:hypothetical protein
VSSLRNVASRSSNEHGVYNAHRAAGLLGAVLFETGLAAEGKFRRLSGTQIQSALRSSVAAVSKQVC